MTPQDFNQLSKRGQRDYLDTLTPQEFGEFMQQCATHQSKMFKQSMQFTGQVKTTDLPKQYLGDKLTSLQRSLGRRATLVDVIAEFPDLKQYPYVMQMVRDDFNRIINKKRA